jgi:orotidine-5'-phosphate decarboxylase
MATDFSTRLRERIFDGGHLCVGIDPSRRQLERWDRDNDPSGLEFAAMAVLDAVSDVAVAVKPQVAYFERFGSAGYRVLERVMADARDLGILVIADAKRGDIDSTNMGYAEAWLSDGSPLVADAVTFSPYLGIEAIDPVFSLAAESGRGVFVVVSSSNDEGRAIQTARTDSAEPVEEYLLRSIAERNHGAVAGTVGTVYGATRDRARFDFAELGGPILAPGAGTQGADPGRIGRLFERCAPGSVLVNVARAIGDAGPEKRALRDAAQRWRDDLASVLG